jgi:hypothetical protein
MQIYVPIILSYIPLPSKPYLSLLPLRFLAHGSPDHVAGATFEINDNIVGGVSSSRKPLPYYITK